jgi:hypothetical protein
MGPLMMRVWVYAYLLYDVIALLNNIAVIVKRHGQACMAIALYGKGKVVK